MLPIKLGGTYSPEGNNGHTMSFVAGLLATNDAPIASDITIENRTKTTALTMLLGSVDGADGLFTGDICDIPNGTTDHALALVSDGGGTATFTGNLSGFTKAQPVEVMSEGKVVLSGDNTGLAKGLSVRSGSLVLGASGAAGNEAILLGGTVPAATTVRAYSPKMPATFTKASGDVPDSYAQKNAGDPWVIDGVTLEVGDLVLVNSYSCAGLTYKDGVFELGSDNVLRFVSDFDYTRGMRVYVEEGTDYAGRAYRLIPWTSNAQRWEYAVDYGGAVPTAKLLAKGGVTIANDINVTDNRSTGLSAIGSADASTVTFSGAITLAKDVFFEAAEGSTVNVTGTISNEGGFNIGFAGLGTTVFAQGLNVAGKAIAVTLPVDGVPTEGALKYVLAKGLSGTPASVTLATADGSTVPGEWTARVVGSKLVFRNKAAGFGVIVR